MNSNKVQTGSRVQVSLKANHQQGRTGMVLESHGTAEGSSAQTWLVRFDWPLGGMGSYAEVSEEDLELLLNIPNKGETPP